MEITIVDVEHGNCALIETDTGKNILIDCGHNSSSQWRPSVALPQAGVTRIDRFFVTNFDEDHVSDLANLRQTVNIDVLHKNPTVTGDELLALKTEHGAGNGIKSLSEMMNKYTSPVDNPPDLGALSYKSYWNKYSTDFQDENNLSLVTFFTYHNLKIVFAGDMEKAGWLKLLENADFVAELPNVNVFMASHHGRESGCCEEVFDLCKPEVVLMSDKAIQYDTQNTQAWYRARSLGMNYNGGTRHVFTTRSDGTIRISASASAITISAG